VKGRNVNRIGKECIMYHHMYGDCVTVWCGLEWDTLRDFFFQLHGRARENRNGGIITSSWWCMCVCHSVCVVTTNRY
jgi:hypothetical protein